MNILLITNDWKPKTGGISTYLRSLVENLDHKFFIYGPSWIEGDGAYPAADTFIINPRKVFEDIQKTREYEISARNYSSPRNYSPPRNSPGTKNKPVYRPAPTGQSSADG